MSRKVELVTIDDGDPETNRDYGKVFRITEMSAMRGERWATRALLALGKSMPEMPEDLVQLGWLGIVRFGLHSFLSMDFKEATDLLEEMLTCVEHIPDPAKPATVSPLALEQDVEEVRTLLRLREEVFRVHTGFSIAASLSNLGSAASTMWSTMTTATSPAPSEQSSPPGSPEPA